MSLDSATGNAEASTSSKAPKKAKRMVDGREETKEERRARKEAKRARLSKPTEAVAEKTLEVSQPSPFSSTAKAPTLPSNQDDAVPSSSVDIAKMSKKDKKRKRAEETNRFAPENSGMSKAGADASNGDTTKMGTTTNGDSVTSGLSEPARKALQYVQSYTSSHLSSGTAAPGQAWKFNKANQNWLIRNVWNESEIPEEHVDAVMAYLNTIKGGGRQSLIDMAEKCRTAPAASPANATSVAPPGGAAATATVIPSQSRSVGSDTTAAAAIEGDADVAVSAEEAERDRQVIKARAEKLLALLRA